MSAETLDEAYGYGFGGRWSFTLDALSVPRDVFVTPDLLSVTMEAPRARPWVINQSAFQYQGGTIGDPTFPSRNQVDARGYFMALTWAVDGAQEQARVDYRQSGGSFQITASMIRVAVGSSSVADPSKPLPIMAGSICPGTRACRMPPTLTDKTLTATANGGSAIFAIPPRAVAYRVYGAPGDPTAGQFGQVIEESPDFIPIQVDANRLDPGGAGAWEFMTSRAQWYPTSPRAGFIRIFNQDPTFDHGYLIQWVLDLG